MDLALAEWLEFNESMEANSGSETLSGRVGYHSGETPSVTAVGCITVYISACGMRSNQAGFGGIAVDDRGTILRAWAVPRGHVSDPVALMLLAIRYAQLEADRYGWKKLQIKSDVQAIMNRLQQ